MKTLSQSIITRREEFERTFPQMAMTDMQRAYMRNIKSHHNTSQTQLLEDLLKIIEGMKKEECLCENQDHYEITEAFNSALTSFSTLITTTLNEVKDTEQREEN